ncbi:preprotein translocase subunit YajC [Salimicrobium jeotgali]|uniref:Preprotein translocase subunit YajC n=1 Tax=Salimicrobium jeotgali TaxID=1230341 RepID=K2GD62_9BACI|nr:preprotein translocase subunit YajC [Salimicrobium jeotgali]AKG04225.1 preprotein translocase subunit YajC [Salimicrobium jeotgali]EKE32192.1 preprotein translocase subunit YajC [Salimicrobium jeotgali]MBM7695803.1 preprotein translocase subunit YajC [Salimicrobium jeotgali]
METLIRLLPIILMFVIFYFLLIRPQQKKQKQVQQMQSELQKGDEIITIGGIHGTIHALDEGTVVVTVNDGSSLKMDRSSVRERKND